MDIGRSFRAMFEDPHAASKLLLALLFSILVVTGPAVIGFWLRYVKNVAEGRDGVLPDWSGFGTYWVRGLLVILSSIVYVIVGLILLIVGIIPALITLQAAVIEYAMTEQAGSLFAIGTVWRRITTVTSFWVAWLLAIALGIGASAITSALAAPDSSALRGLGFVVNAVLSLYVSLVSAGLYGQYARQAYVFGPPVGAVPPPQGTQPPPPAPGGYMPPPVPHG